MFTVQTKEEKHGGVSMEILQKRFTFLGQTWKAHTEAGAHPELEKKLKGFRSAWSTYREAPITESELEVIHAYASLVHEGCSKQVPDLVRMVIRDFKFAVRLFIDGHLEDLEKAAAEPAEETPE